MLSTLSWKHKLKVGILCPFVPFFMFMVGEWEINNMHYWDVINIVQKYFWVVPPRITSRNDLNNKTAQIIFLTFFV